MRESIRYGICIWWRQSNFEPRTVLLGSDFPRLSVGDLFVVYIYGFSHSLQFNSGSQLLVFEVYFLSNSTSRWFTTALCGAAAKEKPYSLRWESKPHRRSSSSTHWALVRSYPTFSSGIYSVHHFRGINDLVEFCRKIYSTLFKV